MARVASVEADVVVEMLLAWRTGGMTSEDVADLLYEAFGYDELAALIDYEHRLQLRAAIWLEQTTGLSLTGKPVDPRAPKSDVKVTRADQRNALASGLKQASAVLQWSPGVAPGWNLPALGQAFEAMGETNKSAARRAESALGSSCGSP